MSRHLTQRFWLCLVFGWGAAGLALLTGSIEVLAVGAPFLAVLVVSLIDGWWPAVEVGTVTVSSPRVVEGDRVDFSLELSAERPTLTEVELQFPASLEPLTPARFVLTVDGSRTVQVSLQATRWGAAGPEWVVVTSRDRLGVSERVVRQALWLPVRIHPPAERLKSLLPLVRERAVTGEHRSRARGAGSELAEIRDYRYGDPVRMIHPRLSARRGSPVVVERHPDRSSDVVILVDSAQDLGVDLDTTLRWTVTATMALGERHLRAQDRVGLLDIGRGVRWLPARLGRRHLHTVVDTLLATEVLDPQQAGMTQHRLPLDGLPRTATIVAVSPLLSASILAALVELRSRQHEILVVKPSLPQPVGDVQPPSLLAQRIFRAGNELNERWLRERGVVVIPWSTGDALEHVMRRVVSQIGRQRQSS